MKSVVNPMTPTFNPFSMTLMSDDAIGKTPVLSMILAHKHFAFKFVKYDFK